MPARYTSPVVGMNSPLNMDNVVDFPAPLIPDQRRRHKILINKRIQDGFTEQAEAFSVGNADRNAFHGELASRIDVLEVLDKHRGLFRGAALVQVAHSGFLLQHVVVSHIRPFRRDSNLPVPLQRLVHGDVFKEDCDGQVDDRGPEHEADVGACYLPVEGAVLLLAAELQQRVEISQAEVVQPVAQCENGQQTEDVTKHMQINIASRTRKPKGEADCT